MKTRPELNRNISVQDFKEFYWYRAELIDFCRLQNLDKRGGKVELSKRVENFLKTGEGIPHPEFAVTSRFDWNAEKLTVDTVITDSYKNTENVRAFFKKQIGHQFKFNVQFMNWMKNANGKTLGAATEQWISIMNERRISKSEKEIAPQFEYNTYIRDFMKDNPDKSLQHAIICWKSKKLKPGNNKYTKSDLN